VTRRDAWIAVRARLFRLLADRPEYRSRDLGERLAATSRRRAPQLSPVDVEAIENADDLDRLCGAAVSILRRGGPTQAGIVDLFGWLEDDRLAAVALALPEDRRASIGREDPYWSRVVASIDADAIAEVNAQIADFDAALGDWEAHVRPVASWMERRGVDLGELLEDYRRRLAEAAHGSGGDDGRTEAIT
jgi:hypothetical protein